MDAIETVAEALALIDGKSELRRRCKADPLHEELLGYYGGYRHEAEELLKLVRRRGYVLVPARESIVDAWAQG